MPAPIPLPVRQVILKRWRKGESVAIVAEELNLSVRTVQHLVRRFVERGQSGLEPDYAHCATNKLPTDSEPFQKAMQMREQHPGWGSGLIRVLLREQGDDTCPSERTLQRWFRRSLLSPAPPGRRPGSDAHRACHPHDVWQMDAVDQLPLATGQQVSWLRLVDECSGVVLQTTISPQHSWNLVEPTVVQETLRSVFSRWGRPQRLRVDNGTPWGSAGDWPTELALWLIGLGVVMIWNPARTPQDNGVVERSQGTGKRWTEPGTCADADELQRRMDYMDRIQREIYPHKEGKSRLQAFPDVQKMARPYSKTWEQRHWDLKLVLAHLAEYNAVRRVGCSGQVSVYGRDHYIGKNYRGQDIYVFLDPVDQEWVFATPAGTQLCRKVAEELTRQRIIKLQVSHRHR